MICAQSVHNDFALLQNYFKSLVVYFAIFSIFLVCSLPKRNAYWIILSRLYSMGAKHDLLQSSDWSAEQSASRCFTKWTLLVSASVQQGNITSVLAYWKSCIQIWLLLIKAGKRLLACPSSICIVIPVYCLVLKALVKTEMSSFLLISSFFCCLIIIHIYQSTGIWRSSIYCWSWC